MNTHASTQATDTSETFEDRIRYQSCPLCDSTSFTSGEKADCSRHPLWRPPLDHEMRWVTCDTCGHSFTDGYFSDAALAILGEWVVEAHRPGENAESGRSVSASLLNSVVPLKASGTWLDIDFGNGSLLFTAREYGFDAIGIDPDEDRVRQMASLGIDAHGVDFRRIAPADIERLGKVDVISMADVLPQVPFPRAALAAAHALLTNGGVLFLSMPNSTCFLWEQMNERRVNPYWGELRNHHNFGRQRLYDLLNEAGFTPVRYKVSERFRCGMEIIAQKAGDQPKPS